jgi:hypothetical protein
MVARRGGAAKDEVGCFAIEKTNCFAFDSNRLILSESLRAYYIFF